MIDRLRVATGRPVACRAGASPRTGSAGTFACDEGNQSCISTDVESGVPAGASRRSAARAQASPHPRTIPAASPSQRTRPPAARPLNFGMIEASSRWSTGTACVPELCQQLAHDHGDVEPFQGAAACRRQETQAPWIARRNASSRLCTISARLTGQSVENLLVVALPSSSGPFRGARGAMNRSSPLRGQSSGGRRLSALCDRTRDDRVPCGYCLGVGTTPRAASSASRFERPRYGHARRVRLPP
jgi:hypothetical protein